MKYFLALVILLNLACKSDQKEAIILEVHDFTGIAPYLELEGSKTYVVNFWATWCAPCVKELPHFEMLQANYKDSVEVILVSLDFPQQYETKLKPFIQKHNLKSKVVVLDDPDMNSWIPKVDPQWDGAIPVTLIYNASKRLFYSRTFTYNELESELKTFF
ncbi:TlpA family protein disulfide reductase [Flavobacteriaceae bacterium]|nr:TlpA family protein disulfide reductase [Flavobacteriaceae bacterium]MDB9873810.1 TlpA family protein disulfide reductase [Flavobacteriaceae bacterium]MDB9953989.1 TlpA family protein disulfide reductase [Flavobacteriaceae bacterium]